MARFWSRRILVHNLILAGIPFVNARLNELTHEEWDLLGDHAFYAAYPSEKDYNPNRDVGELLELIKSWSKRDYQRKN